MSFLKKHWKKVICIFAVAFTIVAKPDLSIKNKDMFIKILLQSCDMTEKKAAEQADIMIDKIIPQFKKQEEYHLAPKYIQDFAFKCVQIYLKEKSPLQLKMMKITNALTVYDGPPSFLPNYFKDNPDSDAFIIQGIPSGIFFPKNSFKEGGFLTNKQKRSIAHEIVHVIRGPVETPTFSTIWFKEEYLAEKIRQIILYEMKEYDVIDMFKHNILLNCEKHKKNLADIPYEQGEKDGMLYLFKNYPEDESLEKIRIEICNNIKTYYQELNTNIKKPNFCKVCLQEEIDKTKKLIDNLSHPESYQAPSLTEKVAKFKKQKKSFFKE